MSDTPIADMVEKMRKSSCFVYVIGTDDGPVKIGISRGPGGRLDALQTASPYPIKLFGTREFKNREAAQCIEAWTHEFIDDYRLCGEWFEVDADDALHVIDLMTFGYGPDSPVRKADEQRHAG